MSLKDVSHEELVAAVDAGANWLEAPLPVRQRHTDAEQAVCAQWIDEHGDPADWPESVRLAYAGTIARMRAGGAL